VSFRLPLFASYPPEVDFEPFEPVKGVQPWKVYADVPHRYFGSVEALKDYVVSLKEMGVNVMLLLPHFLPSFSEYVVKDYERPCALFGDWKGFASFMEFVEKQGLDRMIDIPFNHADFQAEHMKRNWYKNHEGNGIEAGADDVDADGNRIRVNWGAFILDNSNPELIDYWLAKVIFPHVGRYHVNAIRIDAAWGLDPVGLGRIIRETKARFPHVWFLAENLGMDKLIDLARSGIEAGADRFFNNMYWYSGGLAIPSDVYRFLRQSGGKPSCTLFSSHDVLMPAMKALAELQTDRLGCLSDKALHRQVVERDRLLSLETLSADEKEKVVQLTKLDFLLAAFLSTDLMFVAGSERCLLESLDVLRSGPADFGRGIGSDLPEFMAELLKAKASDKLFASEGVTIPFGRWKRGEIGCKGYVRTSGRRHLLVAVNTNLSQPAFFRLPKRIKKASALFGLAQGGRRGPLTGKIGPELALGPGQATVIFTPE